MEDIEEELDHADGWKAKLLKLKKSLSVKVKILLSFLQIVTSMGFNLGVKFPLQFTNFLSALNFVSFNIFVFIPLGCLKHDPDEFYYEYRHHRRRRLGVHRADDHGRDHSRQQYRNFSAGLTLLFYAAERLNHRAYNPRVRKVPGYRHSYLKVDLSITCKGKMDL